MKRTMIAVFVLGGLAAATGQDTVKLPDADFLVVRVCPQGWHWPSARKTPRETQLDAKNWRERVRRSKAWVVTYALPGDQNTRTTVFSRKIAGVPTREEVRLAVRTHILKTNARLTRPPREVWKLVGRYYRRELREQKPLPTPERW